MEEVMNDSRLRRFLVAFATVMVMVPVHAGVPAQAADAARMRTLFFQRDYETALLEGAKLGATSAPDTRAWFILNQVRRGDETAGVAAARAWVKDEASSGWAWFALAGALNYQAERITEAIEASDKSLTLMPAHPDFIWLHAQALASDAKRRAEALTYVDSMRAKVPNAAQLLCTKGYVLYVQSSGRTRDEAKLAAALDVFAEARRLDPKNVDAHYQPGSYLSGLRRADEAIALLKEAVALAPTSTTVHRAYWSAINGSTTMTREAKDAAVKADLEPFLEKSGDRSGALYAVSSAYGDLKLADKQKEIEEMILAKFPDTIDAEWVMAYRWREIGRTPEGRTSPAYRKLLSDYIARPRNFIEGVLGEAYRNLFFILADEKDVDIAGLKRVLAGMVAHETTNTHITHGSAMVTLADKKLLLPEAEKIARTSVDTMTQKVEKQREFYDTAGDYERAMGNAAAVGYDALGWVLYAQGKNAEAETQLLKSYDMNHENRVNLDHLGQFYEAKGDITAAESYYVKGLSVQAPGVNPNETHLKALFAKTHPGGDGFDAYIADLREKDRVRRYEKILGDRAKAPVSPPAFDLKTIDGKRVSLESLKGKVVAINFWGIWCGWCVQELPDYQKLFEKYKDDPDIVILTIDNDKIPDDVSPWMKEKKYNFPVLLDDGFVAKAGITAFPTTWFVDREGRLAFTKVGWSEKLIEEFSWRLEALRR
jgi:tetratricopeptide (TPR) repeat protein